MSAQLALKMYEVRTILSKSNVTGQGQEPFYLTSGSRMLVTLLVSAIDPGATVRVYIDNTFDTDEPYEVLDTIELGGTGRVKRVYSDFNNTFRFRYDVTGGNATFKVAVAIYDNANTTRIENAQIDVSLDHTVDSVGHFDSTRIGDGSDLLEVNDDGSINVVAVDAADEVSVNPYDEAPGVASGAETVVLQYVVPADKIAFLYRVEASGENTARFQVFVNSEVIATRRTHHGSGLTTDFDFVTASKKPVPLQPGDVVEIKVLHSRPMVGDFEARAQLLLKAT